LHGYVTQYGLNATALRLSSVYGPRRQTACGLRAVIEAGLAGRSVTVAAENSSFRQYIHVDDAARAVCLALDAGDMSEFAYNITGGTYVTEADLAREIAALVPGLTILPGPPAWGEGHLGPLLIDAAARDLGFAPRVTLREGLVELVNHIKASGETA
jgi:nucleoside-diphosphate-sugar epimerase